jgi:hypothetical protein
LLRWLLDLSQGQLLGALCCLWVRIWPLACHACAYGALAVFAAA